ncbi:MULTISPECIES: sensor histidine kinase [Niastella]|uniref:histidine kinase n=1 Tax=Niastella soli TaxID=2821487 RepID=A0ABS3Z3B7_9BACT|nr:PAS domain S-box protein [Niastella soli]MBO9204130.1 PAS domain S-box protein [Niastella soli]
MRVHSNTQQGNFPAVGSADNPVFNAVFNSLDVGILVADSDGYFVDMNDSFCQLTGYERRELIGKYFLTVVPDIQRDFTYYTFTSVMSSPVPRQTVIEFPIQRKDGHIFRVNCKVNVLVEPDGNRYMMVSITDVTETNNYKHLLEETELATGIGGWQLDVQSNRLSCTEGMYKLLEIAKYNTMCWEDILSFVGSDAYLQFKQAVHLAVEKGTPFNLELDCTGCSSGKWIRAIGRPKQVFNKTIQLFGTFQDITKEKKAEQMLQLGQSKYRAIANSSLYAFILGKPDGTILETNIKARELFGYSEEEFKKIHRKDIAVHTPEFYAMMDERLKKGFVQGELIGIKRNGEQFPCEFSSVYFKDINGEDRLSTVLRDISARKRVEEELNKLSHIARETLCAILIYDLDNRIQWVNAAFTQITEYTLEEAVGKRPEDFLYGDETSQESLKEVSENKKAGRTFETEYMIYSKSGRKKWVTLQGQPQFDKLGMLTGYFAIAIDSTERKKSEEQMLHNQKLLQQAERLASLGSWETNLKSGITIWSDEMYRIFGWDTNNVTPTMGPQMSTIHAGDMEYVLNSIKDTIEGKGDFDLEHRIVRPDGSLRIIHSQGQLIKNNLGEPEKLIGVVHDITNVKQAEDQLRQHEADLAEERVEHQRLIARATINTQEKERSDIGKELHDNVNQILASAKLFLSSPFLEGDEREKFTTKATEHIHMAIEEIRKLSKSLVSPSAEDLGIIETINDMIGDIRWAQKIDISFNYAGINESKLDYGLKLTIYRIVQEQMSNILKHAEATQVVITLKEQAKKLILTIFDNGKGFDPQTRRKGIGLNNIINRVDVFNGMVDIESAPGQGCMVRVVFDK